jgi:thiol-disulfide isomerase/thioredoxin
MFLATILAVATTLAPITGAMPWLHGDGGVAATGKVTIVDIFTFGCINCKHVTPELKKLRASISPESLAIVGVHAPETAEEHVHANVVDALRTQGVTWPVLFDDDFKTWNAYGVNAWPTQLVFDKHGKLRATYVGEGYDTELEHTVRTLIGER